VTNAWPRFTTRQWVVGSFLIAVAVFVMSRTLSSEPGADLRGTARWSFVLFWLGTTGGALARLFGARFAGLARRARDLSLAYASAHLMHLAIVVQILFLGPPQPVFLLVFFGIGVFFTYLLALLSVTKMSVRLNPLIWRIVRTVGVEYISLVFIADFYKRPFDEGLFKALYYGPFLALALVAPVLRWAAYVKRAIDKRKTSIASTRWLDDTQIE
jgi:hypothetical protein